MKKVLVGIVACFFLTATGLCDIIHRDIISGVGRASDCYSSNAAATANNIRYGKPINVQNCDEVIIYWTVVGCNATSQVTFRAEHLLDDFTDANRLIQLSTGTDGYALTSGWNQVDATTLRTVTAAGTYITRFRVKAPYFRVGVSCNQNDDDGKTNVKAAFARRYRIEDSSGSRW